LSGAPATMKISELVEKLEKLKHAEGDIEVVVQTLSHAWAPEPVVKETVHFKKVVLLNP